MGAAFHERSGPEEERRDEAQEEAVGGMRHAKRQWPRRSEGAAFHERSGPEEERGGLLPREVGPRGGA